MDGFGAMAWRGQGLDATYVRIAVMIGFAVLFGTLAGTLFLWERRPPFLLTPASDLPTPQRPSTSCSPAQIQLKQSFSSARRANCNSIRGGLIYDDRFPKS
jgi:hypothetical protein